MNVSSPEGNDPLASRSRVCLTSEVGISVLASLGNSFANSAVKLPSLAPATPTALRACDSKLASAFVCSAMSAAVPMRCAPSKRSRDAWMPTVSWCSSLYANTTSAPVAFSAAEPPVIGW